MADFSDESGTTKEQRYKLAVERDAVVTGQTKAPLITSGTGELSLSEARELFDQIIEALPRHAVVLSNIKAEYEERLESALSSSENRRTPQSATEVGSVEGLTEYKVLQKHAHQIADLEEQIQATKAENTKLKGQIREQEEVCDQLSTSMCDRSSGLQSTVEEVEKDKYISEVHELQAKIADLKRAIRSIEEESSQMALIAECHPLEQCLKEAEIKNLRAKKKNEELKVMFENLQRQLSEVLENNTATHQ